jgi:hypothetical protein
MKAFNLQPAMLSYGGVFYPVGYMFLMFPTERDAREATDMLVRDGYDEDEIALLTPDLIRQQLARCDGHALPRQTLGEIHAVHRFLELAQLGHHALMVHAPAGHETSHIMAVLKGARISYGQKYRPVMVEHLGGTEASVSLV